jgi:hypothetical protein
MAVINHTTEVLRLVEKAKIPKQGWVGGDFWVCFNCYGSYEQVRGSFYMNYQAKPTMISDVAIVCSIKSLL